MGISTKPGRPIAQRPGILTFLGVIGLVWGTLSLGGLVVGVVLWSLFGFAGWLAGPLAGAATMAVGALAILWMVLSSCLSLLLARSGWLILRDDPSGIPLQRLWAWISLGLMVVGLLFRGRGMGGSWFGLAYPVFVLYATNWPEVRSYHWGRTTGPSWGGKPFVVDDEAF